MFSSDFGVVAILFVRISAFLARGVLGRAGSGLQMRFSKVVAILFVRFWSSRNSFRPLFLLGIAGGRLARRFGLSRNSFRPILG